MFPTRTVGPVIRGAMFLGLAGLGLAAAPSARAQLNIMPTYDSSITSDPNGAAIQQTIQKALDYYRNTVTNPLTINITFKADQTISLGQSEGFPNSVDYSDYVTALRRVSQGQPFLAFVPDTNPVNSSTKIEAKEAHLRLLGLVGPPNGPDSTVSFKTSIMNLSRTGAQDPAKYDLLAVVEHEINEVLGVSSGLNGVNQTPPSFDPQGPVYGFDLFRYSAPGVRSYTTDANAVSYLSADGGKTPIVYFSQAAPGDYHDWYSSDGNPQIRGPVRVQDANGMPGTTEDNGPAELAALQLIGYSLAATPSTAAPPLTAATVTGPMGKNGYYTGPVQVALEAKPQGSPVTGTFDSVDGGPMKPYTGPITVSGEGPHTVKEGSTDAAGETEVPNTVDINIDAVEPVTAGSVSGRQNSAGAYLDRATVTLTATDDLSGVAGISYSLDGAPAQAYKTPLSVSAPGPHTVAFFSEDLAGNVEAPKTLTFTVSPSVLTTFPAGLQMLSVPENFQAASQGLSPAPAKMASWDPALVQYTLSGPADPLTPGRGYWARLAQPTPLMDAGTAVPTNAPFAIALSRGWNMIGDPFFGPVALSAVQVRDGSGKVYSISDANKAGLLYTVFFGYPAGSTAYQTQRAPGGNLQPYQGYWVQAFRDCTLLVPPPAAGL